MNGLNNFDKTDRECILDRRDDPVRFWRSKVKVTAGSSMCDEGFHIDAGASKSVF